METVIRIPDIDEVMKDFVIPSFFSDIKDADKLLTELFDRADGYDSALDLKYGMIWCKYEDDTISEVLELIEGEAQFFLNYIEQLSKKD